VTSGNRPLKPLEDTMADQDHAQGHEPKLVTIIVNGTPHEVAKTEISFAEVVALAYPVPPSGPNIVISVSYRRGHGDKPKGILAEGASVKVKDGMIFDVTVTDKPGSTDRLRLTAR
jgi:Multiubiquitin